METTDSEGIQNGDADPGKEQPLVDAQDVFIKEKEEQRLFPFLNQHVEDLLLWRNVAKSMFVLTAASVLYYFLALSQMKFVTLMAYGLMILVGGAYLWRNTAGYMNSSFRLEEKLPAAFQKGLTEADLQKFSEKYAGAVNSMMEYVRRVLSGKDAQLSMKIAGILFALSQVALYVSPLTVCYVITVLAFFVPKFYELNKEGCDKTMEIAMKKFNEVYSKFEERVLNKIPKSQPVQKKMQ
eukprot:TRINITY_DN2240_c0_g1_i1.p2 TRINITY_DN2240_c0_g1~~TRINITY_DN2240_c0_g1_i1.p2  ORF type:complete len:258 (+),score=27.38 TRINITY_DN2240_c0_g1_i1:60-776(+)